jgi:hypothetical protein
MIATVVLLNPPIAEHSWTCLGQFANSLDTCFFLCLLFSLLLVAQTIIVFRAGLSFMPGIFVNNTNSEATGNAAEDIALFTTNVNLARGTARCPTPSEIGLIVESTTSR